MLTLGWAKQRPEVIKALTATLGYAPEFDLVVTDAMAKNYDDPERFDRMIEATETAFQSVQERDHELQHDRPRAAPVIEGEVQEADASVPCQRCGNDLPRKGSGGSKKRCLEHGATHSRRQSTLKPECREARVISTH